ncbi:hypothetical protein OI25_1440 [Paraburkholderia fungorum]|uniref:Uncharacterized protein n=1 Tax=Paraburkholderia fungorum TaxID=134537 RepID=A0AAU8SXJ0_9BURK|nr:hypothetical protein OI25_1440 [Paraburkholderia fungorum]
MTSWLGSFCPFALSANAVPHALNLPRVVCENGVALNNPLNLDLCARAPNWDEALGLQRIDAHHPQNFLCAETLNGYDSLKFLSPLPKGH